MVKKSKIKKIIAIGIDLILMPCFVIAFSILIMSILFLFFGDEVLKFNNLINITLFIAYFWMIPKLTGGSFGYKIMKIKEPYSALMYISPLLWWLDKRKDDFPQKDLKKDGSIKVVIKDGRWSCPSCGETSLEVYDICNNCGQEISKE